MFGQKDLRYELYSLGQDQQLNLLMIDKMHIQPYQINKKENYVIFEYDAEKSVKLDTLLESLPFIALSLKQIVLIIKEICFKLKEFQTQNLAIKSITYKNILIHVDEQFTYYELKTNRFKIEFIGIEFLSKSKIDQFKLFNQTKKLIHSILSLVEQKYIKQPKCTQILQEWNEFYRDLFLDDDFSEFINQYLRRKASDKEQIRFQYEKVVTTNKKYDYFQISMIEEFDQLIKKEIQQFEEGLELSSQFLKIQVTSLLINKCFIMLYDSIDSYLQSAYSYINYYYIKDVSPQISDLFNEILKKLKQSYNFDALFQQEYDDNISLSNHFKSHYNIQKDWFKCLGLINLMPDYLMISAKANYLNNFVAFKQILDYLQSYPLQQSVIEIQDNPFNAKIFEPFLILKLQDYITFNIKKQFEQSTNKIIQEIQIQQEEPFD